MVNQFNILLAFFITGIFIGILFDIFRVIRKSFKTPDILTYIQDILFWILTGITLLFTIFTFTTGEVRLYMIIFLIFGSFIYFISISKYFILINTKVLNCFKSIINFILIPFIKLKKLIIFLISKISKSHFLVQKEPSNKYLKKKKKKFLENFSKSSAKWRILCYNVEIDI